MRIGRMIVDTDSMSIEELTDIINELRKIRQRRQEAKDALNTIRDAIFKAKENGFAFIDKDFGNVIEAKDIELYDERACRNEN